jgi:hypothetical protein
MAFNIIKDLQQNGVEISLILGPDDPIRTVRVGGSDR